MTLTKIPCNQDINNDERQGQDCKNSSNRHGYEDLHLSAFCNENGLKFSFEWLYLQEVVKFIIWAIEGIKSVITTGEKYSAIV